MVKKIRYQENRKDPHRNRRERWVFEPMDAVLLAIVVAVVIWLQWLMAALNA